MPTVAFTRNLQRHVEIPTSAEPLRVAPGETLAAVMASVFERYPAARSYILEDHGGLRKHIIIFIDGQPLADRAKLTDPVGPAAEVYVMQALSGG